MPAGDLARQFLAALASGDPARLEAVLAEGAQMRVYGAQAAELHKSRPRVVARLHGEWAAWPDPALETLTVIAAGDRAAVEFRLQATEHGRYVEHLRSAFLTVEDGRIAVVELYCPAPFPSARRTGWLAPPGLDAAGVRAVFAAIHYLGDVRENAPGDFAGRMSLTGFMGGSGGAHPGSNEVAGVRWTAEEADARIEAIIEQHRRQNAGFQWFVSPDDTPPDLAERLERHGLALAGEQALMARTRLDDLDLPVNPDVMVEIIDGSDEAAFDAVLQIVAVSFNWTPEQVAQRRPYHLARLRDPQVRAVETEFLARLDGQPVGNARLVLRGGVAYLGGAATLPAFRGRKVYSTLLRRRLEAARDRGFHLAAIHAEPMSKRVVSRYGFEEYGRVRVYGWMPEMDLDVIRSLVPND
jgi:ketosteroid isomerase-like protein/GNAT superfamily N-acetyltransferase